MAEKKKQFNPKSGENSRMIRLLMHSQALPKIDITDPEQLQERISEYFNFCQMHNLYPGICGMANWLGVHRDTLNAWKNGITRKDTHQKIIQEAYGVIEDVLVSMLYDDKVSSPVGIFILKSVFGYKDRFDIGLEAAAQQSRDPLADLRLSDEKLEDLRRKYLIDALPEENPDPEDGKEGD